MANKRMQATLNSAPDPCRYDYDLYERFAISRGKAEKIRRLYDADSLVCIEYHRQIRGIGFLFHCLVDCVYIVSILFSVN